MRKFQYTVIGGLLVVFGLGFWGCARDKDTVTSPETDTATLKAGNMSCTEYNNPAVTSNNEFRVELAQVEQQGNLLSFTYQVCKVGNSPQVRNLQHWVLGLDQFFPYLAENMTMSDVYVNCGILDTSGNGTCGLTVLDSATQVMGVKFDSLSLGDSQCQRYLVTLDEMALAEGFQLGTGSVVVATKGGRQDLTSAESAAPGFACVAGPGVQETNN